jgi:mono/diheme cytochrome c family protein
LSSFLSLGGLAPGIVAGFLLVGGGCRPGPEAQLELGRATYHKRCAVCHDGGNRTGPELTAGLLGGYGTATKLYDYVSSMMPQEAPGSLSPEEYRAIVTFLTTDRVLLER